MSHFSKCRFGQCDIVPDSREVLVKRTLVWIAAIVVTALTASSAQENPNLSGVWVALKDTPATLPLAP